MNKKYYEAVFEGDYKAVYGMLEGFRLASGKNWFYSFSKRSGVKAETLSDVIVEWVTLSSKLHHVILEGDFFELLQEAVHKKEDSSFIKKQYLRSGKIIKGASFKFTAVTYGRLYGTEIKSIFSNIPDNIELSDYAPVEKINKEAKGTELYAPEHEYNFEASGKLSGGIKELIEFRKKLDEHPLVEVDKISIELQ